MSMSQLFEAESHLEFILVLFRQRQEVFEFGNRGFRSSTIYRTYSQPHPGGERSFLVYAVEMLASRLHEVLA